MAKEPKFWNVDEIHPLPKRLYKRAYGDNFNENTWELRPAGLSKSEKETLLPILKDNKLESLYLIPEVEKPQKIKTPDLLINGRRVEIKSVSSKRSIESQTRKAYRQVGDGGLIIYDVSRSQLSRKEIISEITKRNLSKQVSGFIISDKKKVVTAGFLNKEKTGYSSASYATNEGSLFLNSILAQKPQKVNSDKLLAPKVRLRTQTHAYWQKRSIERTLLSERQTVPYIRQTRRVYAEASRSITRQVQDIYAKYYKDNGFDVQALRQIAPQDDVRRLKARMRKAGLETELPDNYAFRVSRLEALNLQTRLEAYEAGQKIKQLTGKSLSKTYQTGYYHTIYDTAKGIGHTPAFSLLNKDAVDKVLQAKNYGKNFSERIWGRSKKLGDELQQIIGTAIATGQSPAKTMRLLRDRFDVSASAAERLIRTETNYYENQAELDAYKEMGVEEYQFVATIDTRTSEICQHLDHKVYKVKDAQVGVNAPPMHPNCRSTVTAYFGKEWEPEVRIARDSDTGRNKYITNMSYSDWAKENEVFSVDSASPTFVPAGIRPIKYRLGEDNYQMMSDILAKASKDERDLYETYENDLRIIDPFYKGRSHYLPGKGVRVNIRTDARGSVTSSPFRVLFHELGHNIDFLSGGKTPFSHTYKNGLFPKTLKEEALEAVIKAQQSVKPKRSIDGIIKSTSRQEAYRKLSSTLNTIKTKDSSFVSDIFSGATYNNVSGRSGHSSTYWRANPVRLSAEAFTQMFSANIVNPNGAKLIKQYFPKSYEIYKEMIMVMKNGKM